MDAHAQRGHITRSKQFRRLGDAWKNVDEVIVHAFLFVVSKKCIDKTTYKSNLDYEIL